MAIMCIDDLQCTRHSLLKALRWLENSILKLVFANTVFQKVAILLILEAEITENVRHSLVSGPKE